MASMKGCPSCGASIPLEAVTCPKCGKDPRVPGIETAPMTADFTPAQKQLFDAEFDAAKKNGGTGFILALLFGGLGAHHFYMGWWLAAIIYLLFCWTFIPMILGVIEAFLMGGRVARHNDKVAKLIAARINVAAEAARPLTAVR